MNTSRVLLLPDDQSVILFEVARPAEALVAEIRAGEWVPPEPYSAWLPAAEDGRRVQRLRAVLFGRLIVVVPAHPVQLPPAVVEEVVALYLSPRQRQVLECLCDGLNNKQIAERLGLKMRTVAYHVAAIKTRLGASSRAQLVGRAAALGFLRQRGEAS
jgi:DNA-binding CsgD family transcriptional regulator